MNYFQQRLRIFESAEHTDVMMKDLGLRADRKRMRMSGGWKGGFGLKARYAEWFEGYFASDFKGPVQEFMEVEKRGGLEKVSYLRASAME